MNTSFEEKSIWIQLAGIVLVLGGYFVTAGKMMSGGIDVLPAYVPLFISTVILMVILIVAGHVIAAIFRRPEKRDERDRIIEWRSESNSGWLLAVGVLTAITCMVLSVNTVWVAHLLLLSLFLSEVLKCSLQLWYYRRGM